MVQDRTNLLAIEAGGTTFKLSFNVINNSKPTWEKLNFDHVISIQTRTPNETMADIEKHCKDFIRENGEITAVGIACFGPIQLNRNKENYGSITSTPKLDWRNFNIVESIKKITKCNNIAFDTDVNAPAYLESLITGLSNVAYVTVGTGVGIGLVVNGKTVHGLVHPEGGHVMVPIAENDTFKGVCPYHKTCVEGMSTSVAIKERCKLAKLNDLIGLPDEDQVWDTISHYLAHLCVTLLFTNSVERIALGGGVMERKCLFPKIREKFLKIVNGYIQSERFDDLESYIVEPKYGSKAGIAGAFALIFHDFYP